MSQSSGAGEQKPGMEKSMETESLWREFHDRMLSYIRRRVATDDDAEDLLQDVFLRFHAHIHDLRDSQNVTAWVYRIASNVVADFYRARAKAAGALRELAESAPAAVAPAGNGEETRRESSTPSAELARCMEPLLKRLPEKYGEAIGMTDLGGLSQKEAARQLGLSVSGMKSRVQRGRRRLKGLLIDCCHVELDQRRDVVEYKRREGATCSDCGCD